MGLMKFSANLGFLWNNKPLPEAIRAAHAAGFNAVECHWPYDIPSDSVRAALNETGLPLLGLNTRRGNLASGENGLSALPGREKDARLAIDEAVAYATSISAKSIHVMAGNSSGPRARQTFCENLTYACETAGPDISILIEPLNGYNAPGYFLNSTDMAADIIREIGSPNLRLMFDFYHVQILDGDVTRRFERLLPLIGHVQIAAVPDRGPPDHGELDYSYVLARVSASGWSEPIGAEYLQGDPIGPDLKWLARFQNKKD